MCLSWGKNVLFPQSVPDVVSEVTEEQERSEDGTTEESVSDPQKKEQKSHLNEGVGFPEQFKSLLL